MMTTKLPPIDPHEANKQHTAGAMLIDIRSAGEFRHCRIPGAQHIPIGTLKTATTRPNSSQPIIFYCHSGLRTQINMAPLCRYAAGTTAYVLTGGLSAWRKAGLSLESDASAPLPLQQQVQITTGTLIVLGTAAGLSLSEWLFILPAAVGCGLIFAGLSGECALARLLQKMPWNRTPPQSPLPTETD